jgi:hypothetical protein
VAVTVTVGEPAVVGVPVIVPVEGSTDSPAGSPVAENVRLVVGDVSDPPVVTAVMAVPEMFAWGPGFTMATLFEMVQLKDVVPVKLAESVTVTVTEFEPAVVGVPVIVPVVGLIDRPAGRPVAPKWVIVAVDELVDAPTVNDGTAEPDTFAWLPGLVTVTVLVMVQLNVADPVWPAESVAVTVTEVVPAVVGVPVTAPVAELIERPAGRPVADHEAMVAVDEESVAELVSAVMAEPDTEVWLVCPATVTVLVIVQENVVEAARAWESVAVTVTEEVPAVVGVPVTAPVAELIERPAGSPVAPKVTELPPVVSWGAAMVSGLMAVPETFAWEPGLVTDRLSTFQTSDTVPAEPTVPVVPPPEPVANAVPEA